MELRNIVKIVEEEDIEILKGDSFLIIAKCGNELHTAYEGERNDLLKSLLTAAQTYKDFGLLLRQAADNYLPAEDYE